MLQRPQPALSRHALHAAGIGGGEAPRAVQQEVRTSAQELVLARAIPKFQPKSSSSLKYCTSEPGSCGDPYIAWRHTAHQVLWNRTHDAVPRCESIQAAVKLYSSSYPWITHGYASHPVHARSIATPHPTHSHANPAAAGQPHMPLQITASHHRTCSSFRPATVATSYARWPLYCAKQACRVRLGPLCTERKVAMKWERCLPEQLILESNSQAVRGETLTPPRTHCSNGSAVKMPPVADTAEAGHPCLGAGASCRHRACQNDVRTCRMELRKMRTSSNWPSRWKHDAMHCRPGIVSHSLALAPTSWKNCCAAFTISASCFCWPSAACTTPCRMYSCSTHTTSHVVYGCIHQNHSGVRPLPPLVHAGTKSRCEKLLSGFNLFQMSSKCCHMVPHTCMAELGLRSGTPRRRAAVTLAMSVERAAREATMPICTDCTDRIYLQ